MLVTGVQMLSARSPPLVVVACMVSLPSCLPPVSCFIEASCSMLAIVGLLNIASYYICCFYRLTPSKDTVV